MISGDERNVVDAVEQIVEELKQIPIKVCLIELPRPDRPLQAASTTRFSGTCEPVHIIQLRPCSRSRLWWLLANVSS